MHNVVFSIRQIKVSESTRWERPFDVVVGCSFSPSTNYILALRFTRSTSKRLEVTVKKERRKLKKCTKNALVATAALRHNEEERAILEERLRKIT